MRKTIQTLSLLVMACMSAEAQEGIVTIGPANKAVQKAAIKVRINDITPILDKKTNVVTGYEVELQNAGTKEVIGTFDMPYQEYTSVGARGAKYHFHTKDFKKGQEHIMTFTEVQIAGPKGEKIVAKQVTGVYSSNNFQAK